MSGTPKIPNPLKGETFHFSRHGRAYHLRIRGAEDLPRVLALDEALWVASSASVPTLNVDPVLLGLLDEDGDGRIRAGDLKAAIRWLLDHLSDLSGVAEGNTTLARSAVADGGEASEAIQLAWANTHRKLGVPEGESLTLEALRGVRSAQEERGLSEAGVVKPESAEEGPVRALIEDVLTTEGGVEHPSGGKGVTVEHLDRMLEGARTQLTWLDRAELEPGQQDSPVMPLGPDTVEAFAAYQALRPKLAEYFDLCDAARIDPELAKAAWEGETIRKEFRHRDSEALRGYLREAPLAPPSATGSLVLDGTVNPTYVPDLARFTREVLGRLHDPVGPTLERDEWQRIDALFEAHRSWVADRPEVSVGDLDEERLRAIVSDADTVAALEELLAESHLTALDLGRVRALEKLILLQAWILPLANSFVSFPDLYHAERRALFEMGTLIMDGRRFTLAVRVQDRKVHARMSDESNLFVLFAEVSERDGTPLYEVAVPVTSGGRGNLGVGKRGLFVDTAGRELHARVVQIVENPIAFGEALAAPFSRLGRALSERLEKMQEQAEKKIESAGIDAADQIEKAGQAPATDAAAAPATEAAPAPAAAPSGSTGGWLAGGGIAVAALGSSGAFVIKTLAGLSAWAILGGIASILLAVLLPILTVAWLKLRRRDLSAILEGSDWGINARMSLTHSQAVEFTRTPDFPPGSRGVVRRAWMWWLVPLLLALAALALYASRWWI